MWLWFWNINLDHIIFWTETKRRENAGQAQWGKTFVKEPFDVIIVKILVSVKWLSQERKSINNLNLVKVNGDRNNKTKLIFFFYSYIYIILIVFIFLLYIVL